MAGGVAMTPLRQTCRFPAPIALSHVTESPRPPLCLTYADKASLRRPSQEGASFGSQPSTSQPPQRLWFRRSLACRALSDSADPPSTRDECVEQARTALLHALKSGGRKAKKGFRPTAVCRVAIEVPVRDQSAAAMAELMRDLLRDMEEPLVVYCGDDFEQFRTALGKDSVRSFDTLDAPGSRLLFIVGARPSQIGALDELLRGSSSAAVLVNAEWDPAMLPAASRALVRPFKTVYAYQPLQVQMFVVKQEGAVLKYAADVAPDAAPWRIFTRSGDRFVQVGRMTRRPAQEDVEFALVNAVAAQSPLTRGIRGVREALGKLGGGGKG